MEVIEESIDSSIEEIISLHWERYEKRTDISEQLVEQDADVKIELFPFGNEQHFIEKKDDWFGGTGLKERDWAVLTDFIFWPKKNFEESNNGDDTSVQYSDNEKREVAKKILGRLNQFKKALRNDFEFSKKKKKECLRKKSPQ